MALHIETWGPSDDRSGTSYQEHGNPVWLLHSLSVCGDTQRYESQEFFLCDPRPVSKLIQATNSFGKKSLRLRYMKKVTGMGVSSPESLVSSASLANG